MRRALLCLLVLALLCGCGAAPSPAPETTPEAEAAGRMELRYATEFAVDYCADGSALVTVGGADRYRLLPEGVSAPAGDDATAIPIPVTGVYVASSSVMDLFSCLDALDMAAFTSTTAQNWQLPEVRAALEAGDLVYAGKYSAPDYELLLSARCPLAVENTMIYHSPAVKERLEDLGIPMIVERSSYEAHPLGRVEWVKLYGLLLGREAEAEAFFEEQLRQLDAVGTLPDAGQTVAFFHINSLGAAVVRRPGDYVARMIELAGGVYAFDDLELEADSALSTVNLQLERFYAGARDADVLIYNSTIDGPLETLDQLLDKWGLLSEFKAVREGRVWCTEQSMFQRSSASAGMIRDINAVLTEQDTELTFLHKLE